MEPRRDVFQALADPTRREIIRLVSRKSMNLNAIANRFDEVSRQAISLHVKILEECGVLTIIQEGRERQCKVQPRKLAEAAEWLEPFRKMWEDRFDQLDKVLPKVKTRKK